MPTQYTMLRLTILLIISALLSFSGAAQGNTNQQNIDALNEYVHFTNEGVHGMLIVHRLLENYNQEINKYVDLDSYIINNFSNADLPKDIFEDPEDWFYDTSPQEWQESINANSALPANGKAALQAYVKVLRSKLESINQLRFDLEKLIGTKNLNVRSELAEVYQKLEEGVTLYEDYYTTYNLLQQKLLSMYQPLKPSGASPQMELYQALSKVYLTTKLSLKFMREKEDEKLPRLLADMRKATAVVQLMDVGALMPDPTRSKILKRAKKHIISEATEAAGKLEMFINDGSVPVEYTAHGRYYYYYNCNIINDFNRYGSGIVFEMNTIFDALDLPVLRFVEMPHYFKVLYPEKVSANTPIAATNPNIASAPTEIKKREVVPVVEQIYADSLVFSVEIFDSKINDGDVISFNFNRDWLINKQRLSHVPQRLRLQLNEDGKNFFILHSDDVGRNPPTTVGVRYKYNGESQLVKLSSDLNTSQMIEVIYKPVGQPAAD